MGRPARRIEDPGPTNGEHVAIRICALSAQPGPSDLIDGNRTLGPVCRKSQCGSQKNCTAGRPRIQARRFPSPPNRNGTCVNVTRRSRSRSGCGWRHSRRPGRRSSLAVDFAADFFVDGRAHDRVIPDAGLDVMWKQSATFDQPTFAIVTIASADPRVSHRLCRTRVEPVVNNRTARPRNSFRRQWFKRGR